MSKTFSWSELMAEIEAMQPRDILILDVPNVKQAVTRVSTVSRRNNWIIRSYSEPANMVHYVSYPGRVYLVRFK